ncbi:amidohydrolase family protein [Segetibacter sp. 3557_3]|uniref:metal-dependent hydrolase family protein n=1 Tax=Segetibacter sp. 3557_3 TaxID=2547429 RepID=UPI001058E3D7|nr:amidohydrolase family protein [Segetibacter sp. 3557_3]TDH27843.1 amidohydrolase family protein [Segetibacter sp. 3557_3]
MRIIIFLLFSLPALCLAQDSYVLVKADQLFDGETIHKGWSVLIKNRLIEAVGEVKGVPAGTKIINLSGTIMPGLIEGHSHLFLHPYNETSWNDQVLRESRAERTARAVVHAKATLMAGFTTVRDLGTEGAAFDDVGLKRAIEKGVIPGPRMIVATKAIVATGTYGPRSESADIEVPQGAAEVSGMEDLANEVRTQIGKGADLVKIYGDYRWGKNGESLPTFSVEALASAVAIAASGNRQIVVHATTPEGMRRAIMAGVSTIEHGDDGNAGIFRLMKERKVALCPTLAAGDATSQYRGWRKGIDPEPEKIANKRKSFKLALAAGVTICMGGDVGVFTHGDNAREMEMMVEYGMEPIAVLRSATSVNADVFGYAGQIGRIRKGLAADLLVVSGNPVRDIKAVRNIQLVMKDGVLYKVPGATP